MSVQNRRKYDPDFKRNAILLSEEPGRKVSEVAESLGVHSDLIYLWRRQMREWRTCISWQWPSSAEHRNETSLH